MWHDGLGWFGFGWFWMVLLWGALIVFIVWAVTRLSKRDDSKSKVNYIDIAKERYAKGEISKEEFEQLKKDLS
jgi:putative membrane protein